MLKPRAKHHAGLNFGVHVFFHEADLIWEEVRKHNSVLNACVDAVVREDAYYSQFIVKRQEICEAFAELCTPSLEDSCIRPLLESLGILTDYTGSL